jgi:ribosome-associated translation inhibitor RaiA
MQLPLQITWRNVAPSAPIESLIRERAEKLEHFHPHLVSLRVAVELAAHHQHQGKQFVVRVDLKVPGAEIAIDHQKHEDPHVAVRDAFDATRRRLEDELRVQRGDVKLHSR